MRPLLEGWRNCIVTDQELCHCEELATIRSPLMFTESEASFPESCARSCSGQQSRSALPGRSCRLFEGGKWGLSAWLVWRSQPVFGSRQTSNSDAERYQTARHEVGSVLRPAQRESVHSEKNVSLFFLLLVLNIRCFFPWTQKAPKSLAVGRK